jgi:2Fe-2S ferredoxin
VDAEVSFQPSGKQVRVPQGTTLLQAARQVGLPVASGCGAHGLCARCGVTVLGGADSVSPETPAEAEAKHVNRIDSSQRLSCMATICGDVEITASYW